MLAVELEPDNPHHNTIIVQLMMAMGILASERKAESCHQLMAFLKKVPTTQIMLDQTRDDPGDHLEVVEVAKRRPEML